MTTLLRAGLVGVGFMGEVHARAVRAAGGRVSRVLGRTAASSSAAVARLGAEWASPDLASLMEDPEVDVVHVCTPNWMHHEVATLALRAGKHVVCEKPLATTVEDAESLVALAGESGLVDAVPFVYRYHPMVREARARLARGDLGDVWVVHGSYLQDWLALGTDTNWRVDPALGGSSRAFGDIGVHWCDLVEFVSGHRITSVSGRATTAHGTRNGAPALTEDALVVSFSTDRGAIGSLTVSQVSQGRKNSLRLSIDGSEGSLGFDGENPETLWLGGLESTRTLHRGALDADPDAARLDRVPPGHPQGYQDAFNGFVLDTYATISGERPFGLPRFVDGLRAAHLTEAVMAATRSNGWVDVPAAHQEATT